GARGDLSTAVSRQPRDAALLLAPASAAPHPGARRDRALCRERRRRGRCARRRWTGALSRKRQTWLLVFRPAAGAFLLGGLWVDGQTRLAGELPEDLSLVLPPSFVLKSAEQRVLAKECARCRVHVRNVEVVLGRGCSFNHGRDVVGVLRLVAEDVRVPDVLQS